MSMSISIHMSIVMVIWCIITNTAINIRIFIHMIKMRSNILISIFL